VLITLASKTAGILILAAGGRRSPRNLRINSSRVVQEVELLRAPNVAIFDRLNQRNEITFDVLDNLTAAASTGLAEATALLAQRFCGKGTVTFVCADLTGGTFVRYLANAVVQQASAEHLGIMITYSYRIIGGPVSQSAPVGGAR
jgi:hypothetical protein